MARSASLALLGAVYDSAIERAAWTDERLDDLAVRMDAGFARLDADIRDVRAEIGALRITLLRVGGGVIVGLVGVIAAVLANGA